MSAEEATALSYPAALAEGDRGGELFYLPFWNAMGGAAFLADADILAAAGVDPATLTTWDALTAAATAMAVFENGVPTRAGLGFSPWLATTWLTLIDQMGGTWYDPATGVFDVTSGEAIDALLFLDDLLKVHKVDDIRYAPPGVGNTTGYNATPDGFAAGKSAITTWNPDSFSGIEATRADIRPVVIPVPSLGETPGPIEVPHGTMHIFSKRLRDDPAKAAAARLFVETLFDPAIGGPFLDAYAGSVVSPGLAADAGSAARRWGPAQTVYGTSVWPMARTEQHHIADWPTTYVWPQLLRSLNAQAGVEVVLADLEAQSNTAERQIRDRLGLP
jgi:ABC-type glycerol-3-phosphate transport system substrate-binding protein